jgi:hypothetical protein
MEHIEKRLEAQVAKLAELVDYQDGSVVSREIISKKTGTYGTFRCSSLCL